MAPEAKAVTVHVPAWKKLGLRLKFAKELPEAHDQGQVHEVNDKKRKRQEGGLNEFSATITDRASKRIKKPSLRESRLEQSPHKTPTSADRDSKSPPLTRPSTLVKQKSVSFTPETKTEDGEGVKQLYSAWLEKQKADNPSFDPFTADPALRSITPAVFNNEESISFAKLSTSTQVAQTAKKDKSKKDRPKKDKSKSPSKTSNTSQATSSSSNHLTLSYLQKYHSSRDSWKFSKVQQNNLLKHLFSLTYIPSSHDTALLSYLRGLQGSARSRVRKEAFVIREEDDKWLDSELTPDQKMENETTAQCLARRKRDFDIAVAHLKEKLRQREYEREDREWEVSGEKDEWNRQFYKRRRAELVLWGVGEEEERLKKITAVRSQQAILGNSKMNAGGAVTIGSRGMGGVKQISQGGVAQTSQAKKFRFDSDDKEGSDAVNSGSKTKEMRPIVNSNVKILPNGVEKRIRKRKKKGRGATGIPDDDSSSDDSSSDDDDSKSAKVATSESRVPQKVSRVEGSSDDGSDSTLDSDSTSSGDSDKG